MERYFVNYDPSEITEEFLSSHDWDIIELQFTVDVTKLRTWYETVTTTYSNLEFTFFNNPYIKPEYAPGEDGLYGYHKRIYGNVSSWGLDWPAETDLPIPPPFAAKAEYYPELFENKPYKLQDKYNIEYFSELYKKLGQDGFKYARITQHKTDAGILGHVDGSGHCIRMHIPIIAHSGSEFLYGDNLDRSYSFTPGKAYLINASVWHSTVNHGSVRAHIISDPPLDKVLELISIKGQL